MKYDFKFEVRNY